ncbi:tRNA (adenosine(37)-N6)-threonylcarbamoyltransferase complex transferase subunit TsaD [archaeon]|nr:tRNA (adenosine(37)-N6)-threonylcarbamoyltransferase complex transferase subunit TsaD [archaeon]PJC45605.1 MAG: UGMP family protein [Candidatus Pacearchaeota archaeon CG_4_9_14_0_2_um_filter_30_8]
MTIVLGIESTAHTFGIGIVRNGKIISNKRDMYTTKSGGIIPMDSAKHHREVSNKIYFEALNEAKISEEKIDAISFSQGPGLPPCLLEGMKFAKTLSKRLNKPLVPVNHCVAHLEIGNCRSAYPELRSKGNKIAGAKNPVLLYCSGANTQVISYAGAKYRVFGETLDLGVGNFIDTFARYAGLGFPGGPKIEKIALKGKNYVELPYSVKGMDVSFSGILTNLKQKLERKEYSLEDLSFSLQETVFSMLLETAERALAHLGKKELVLGGGVACNSRLQRMSKKMCEERKAKFFCPERSLLVDNGAMIAYLGEIMFKSGIGFSGKKAQNLDIKPRQRTDEVEVSWKN